MEPFGKNGEGDARLREILPTVQRPARYIGGEFNEIVKDHRSVDVRMALAFPDVYEIGMSHLGLRILYSQLNDREDTALERVFCPWPDMADTLRRIGEPLGTLESGTPLRDLDVVGFSLQYEMTFTNVLEMLDLAGIPLRSADRTEDDPLVIAGGPVVFNAEPIADFIDLVLVGDGEILIPEFLDRFKELARTGANRGRRIRELAMIEGVYAPSLYDVEPDGENGLLIPVPRAGDIPHPVRRRILLDLDSHPFPSRILVPHGEIVHDRVSVEIMRGCPVGCRFCQAGYVYRPTRERDPNRVRDAVLRSISETGYDEFSLASLNTGEYGPVQPVICDLMDRLAPRQVSISLASMHASTMTESLMREVRRVRKSGFTIAPEAGTQRLRDVINKNLDEEQIMEACRLAFESGMEQIKLYFMIGLPTETDEDVEAQADLAHRILSLGRATGNRRRIEVTLSASSFVPKPGTPFQWLGMDRVENLYRKQELISRKIRKGVKFKHHECETSFLEAVFSRGDRRLGDVLQEAWRRGARFDGWSEHFSLSAWEQAFTAAKVDPEKYAHMELDPASPLPWSVIDSGVNGKWLARDLARALDGETLGACGPDNCHGCAPFAVECTDGTIAASTGRTFDISTPASPESRDPEGPRYRYRARYSKLGKMRFLGHLDLTRAISRAMRRAELPLSYSHGFNPKPKISFGPALPVGAESESEYLDFETTARIDTSTIQARLNGCIQKEMRFHTLAEIRSDTPSLGDSISAARYLASMPDGSSLERDLERFRGGKDTIVTREVRGKKKLFDLGKEILELDIAGGGMVRFLLAVHPGAASVRLGEVMEALFGERSPRILVRREDLLVSVGERMINPMLAASAVRFDEGTVR